MIADFGDSLRLAQSPVNGWCSREFSVHELLAQVSRRA
jgi:hypothetical protein